MKRIEWEKLVPVGTDYKKEMKGIAIGLAISAVYSLSFIFKFSFSLDELYDVISGKAILISGRYIAGFSDIMEGRFDLFKILFYLLIILGVMHYFGHFSGSKSIYLMRRIPQRWELLVRCAAFPAMGIIVCKLSELILTLLFFAIYMIFTPKGHIPPGQVGELISSIISVLEV